MLRHALLAMPLLLAAVLPASLASPTCVPFAAAVPAPLESGVDASACAEPGGPDPLDWDVTWSGEVLDRWGVAGCAPCPEPPGTIHIAHQGPGVPYVAWNGLDATGLFSCSSALTSGTGTVGLEVTCYANGAPPSGGQWRCFNTGAATFVSTGSAMTTTSCATSVTATQFGPGATMTSAPDLGPGDVVKCRVEGSIGQGWEGTCDY